MKEQDLKELGEAVLKETRTDITPKQLIKAVMKSHPQASKKEIVRAAFYALIAHAGNEPEKAGILQDFAITERTKDDE
ncbi:hypothetical protein [Rhizobium lentis]|uniref:hypothetical protein n=1 Tax=Rhizobium lentis TaxID=1138194 RepID=UPI001C83DC96|nr:hypothetical protein [Rhizobium lentis]MBX5000770.1 hypothetical protein [Rhizobium lentis]MBX5019187.1 hypothetical protein [Rhizobium lentis]MBX5050386.1 hypothetical protein [Rhizobium lentis]MBX5062064.1 hypothetical protein [Rhizobium lentis]